MTVENGGGVKFYPKYSVQISVYKTRGKIIGFQIWMTDVLKNKFSTDNEELVPFLFPPIVDGKFTIEINKKVELWRNVKGQGKIKRESVGDIFIGNLEYTLKTLEQDCWVN